MWSWALHNVHQDHKEQGTLLSSLFEALTWWLQPAIKQKIKNTQTQKWPKAQAYIDDLRKHGASEEYIRKEIEALSQIEEEEAEDSDDMEILRGPNG